jgi:hypothetical protein
MNSTIHMSNIFLRLIYSLLVLVPINIHEGRKIEIAPMVTVIKSLRRFPNHGANTPHDMAKQLPKQKQRRHVRETSIVG